MEYVKFFTSLMWGSFICLPVMILCAREVSHLSELNDYLWIPILTAMFSLMMKTILEKKNK